MDKIIRSFFWTGCMFLLSCNSNNVYSDYQALHNAWDKDESVDFTFRPPDTVQPYNMFIHLRNDENYKFSNLFLIVNLNFPDGKVIADTLEYKMARPDGEWLGQGFTELKESKLWYKENVVFPASGNYTVAIKHAMRKVGEVEGVGELEGITDVGIEIDKPDKK
ncbi:gliding motility lipoprotein GldH [Sinomicrobium weinanense]|uniref:Gliding motility lipoprotein GldH n=1 Tax=Sinomicrobium weinanense TaxID=2842200 RepID=A0A926JNT7_9FLAO|nr:gliding motility lipoprotein GldH [Sinomicrobium weinanense]MBC9794568.1 gliding motility lipoprotein GldH [Sinomicrobium weinanense]MBU3124053.1 gliding motility lipoprotein GldH [Sinomicrobium weinanense]